MDKASCSQCGQDTSTPCESCLPPEETRNQIPVPTHPVIHAHLPLLTLPTPVKFSNSLIFPLNPTDQAQVGPKGSLPFHLLLPSLSLYYTVDPQGQRHLKTHWKKVILWRKKKKWHGLGMVNKVLILVVFLNAEHRVLANSSQQHSLAVGQTEKPLKQVDEASPASAGISSAPHRL